MRYTLCLSSKVSKSWTMFGCFNLEVNQNKLLVLCWKTGSNLPLKGKLPIRDTSVTDQNYFLCFVDRAFRYNRVKKNQLDAQLILRTFRQHLQVLGVPRPIIRRHNRIYTTIVIYYSFLDDCPLSWLVTVYLLMMGLDTSETFKG